LKRLKELKGLKELKWLNFVEEVEGVEEFKNIMYLSIAWGLNPRLLIFDGNSTF